MCVYIYIYTAYRQGAYDLVVDKGAIDSMIEARTPKMMEKARVLLLVI